MFLIFSSKTFKTWLEDILDNVQTTHEVLLNNLKFQTLAKRSKLTNIFRPKYACLRGTIGFFDFLKKYLNHTLTKYITLHIGLPNL